MAAALAPHALRGFGTRSELDVAKSTAWHFPEVSAGAGEEEEEQQGYARGKEGSEAANPKPKYAFPYSF